MKNKKKLALLGCGGALLLASLAINKNYSKNHLMVHLNRCDHNQNHLVIEFHLDGNPDKLFKVYND